MKIIILMSTILIALTFNACSGKEINSRINDFTTDVGGAIEGGVDHSERPE